MKAEQEAKSADHHPGAKTYLNDHQRKSLRTFLSVERTHPSLNASLALCSPSSWTLSFRKWLHFKSQTEFQTRRSNHPTMLSLSLSSDGCHKSGSSRASFVTINYLFIYKVVWSYPSLVLSTIDLLVLWPTALLVTLKLLLIPLRLWPQKNMLQSLRERLGLWATRKNSVPTLL